MIRVWTDGCCTHNPGGAGGWAYVMERKGIKLDASSGGVSMTTNNKMEMVAVLKGIEHAPKNDDLQIVSDSKYVVNGATLWLPGWKERNWRSGRQVIKNRDLWQLLDQALATHPRKITFRWVKGHSGAQFNELADKLAGLAALDYIRLAGVS